MKNMPLAFRITTSLVLITTILLSTFAGILVWRYKETELKELQSRLQLELQKLTISSSNALWYYDTDQLTTVLNAAIQDPAITGILIHASMIERSIGRTADGSISMMIPREKLHGEIHLTGTISKNNTELGTIELFGTTRHLTEQFFFLLSLFATAILILDLLLIFSIYQTLARIVIHPLSQLKSIVLASHTITEKKNDLNRLSFTGEIEVLRHSMLEMINKIESQYNNLQKSEEQFRILVQTIPDLVWLKDAQGIYLTCNKKFANFIGLSEAEIIGKNDYDFFTQDLAEQLRHHDVQTIENSSPTCIDRWAHSAGTPDKILLSITKAPMFDSTNQLVGVIGVARDITKRKEEEEERITLQEQLGRMQKFESIGRLAGGISHDFNNMLSVIIGHTDLLIMRLPEDSPLKNDLQEILEASKRATDLTRQLLAFAKKQKRNPKVLNLNELVTGMARMLTRLIGEDIEMDWQPGEHLWSIQMDPSQIDQILVNLCVNARDAINGVGKIQIQTTNITINATHLKQNKDAAPGDYAKLTVSDTGCGMEQKVLDKIFEPFFTTKDINKGTGLGLSTVFGIVQQNNGFIQVTSQPGKGTQFEIFLPRSPEDKKTEKRHMQLSPQNRQQAGILIIEDEKALLSFIAQTLLNEGYSVFTAESPKEALQVASQNSSLIDLILMDVILPDMHGPELMEKLKQDLPHLKNIYMSGHPLEVLAKQVGNQSITHFLHKPFQGKELVQVIRSVLQ